MADEIKKVIKIESDSSQAQADAEKLQGKFAAVFKNLQTQVSAFAPALGIGAAGVAILNFGKNVIDLGDQLGDLSDQTGLSIEVLGGFRHAAVQNGASVSDLASAVLKAQHSLGEMDEDGKGAAEALKRLGLNVREMQNASPDEFLEKFGQKLATIENRNDRAAIAALLFKKAGDQVNASIVQWVNEGMTRLDESTAQAYRRLGDLKDQLAKLTAASYDFAAKGIGNILKGIGAIPASVKELEAQLEHLKKFAPGDIGAQMTVQKQLDAARAVEAQPKPKPADYRGLAVTKSATAPKDTGVQDFFGGLQKQVEGIDLEFTKLRDGDALAKEIALDLQFADFNMRRLAEGKPLASLEEFKKFKEVILSAGAALEKAKHDLDAIAAVGKAMSQDSAEWLNVGEDLEKIRKEREPMIRQFQDLRQQLQIDLLPEGPDKRVAQILADYQHTSERIKELALAAGASNESAAELASLAWQKALNDIDDATNTTKQQFKEVFEGVGQAFGDAVNQFGSGAKFKDVAKNFASQIQRVITDALVTKPLQEQFKKLGNDIFTSIFGGGGAKGAPLPGGPEVVAGQQFQLSTTQFSAAVAQFSAAVATQSAAAAPAAIAGTTNPANAGSGSSAFNFSGGGMFAGSLLGNWLGKGGGAAVGYGSAPAGVEGPAMANGGFFSSAFGGLSSWFSNLFAHQGGPIGKLHDGGKPMMDISGLHDEAAARIMKQFAALKANERVRILEDGEFVLRKQAVNFFGVDNLKALNEMRGATILPRKLHDGGPVSDSGPISLPRLAMPSLNYMSRTGTIPESAMNSRASRDSEGSRPPINIHFHGITDGKSIRDSQWELEVSIARAVQRGMKHL